MSDSPAMAPEPDDRLDDSMHRFRPSRFWRTLPAGMRRRWWLFRLFDLIARFWPTLKPRRGALVVRMDGIGDMVLFRTSLDHYAQALGIAPAAITVLGCGSWAAIADEVFRGYRVVTIDEHAYARRPLYRLRVNLMVRSLAPAVTVCDSYFRRAMMADSLVWVAGAPRSVVSLPFINEPTRAEFTYYLSQTGEIVNTGVYPTHEVVRHYRFVSALAGRPIAPEPPRIPWREQAPGIAPGAAYVVLNPGSNEYGRRWPIDSYLAIGRRLIDAGYRVCLVGRADEGAESEAFAQFRTLEGVIDLIGRTDVAALMDVLKGAAAALSNDTGPAHLSIALGTPTVVVIGGGHFGSFVPYPDGVRPGHARFVYEEMDCYHCFWRCHKRASKFDVFPCVAGVAADSVWQALAPLLPGPGQP